jgi:hypothetical protein
MREFKTFLGEQQEEMFPGYDEQHREKRLGNWLAKSWGVQNGKPQTFYHATTKDFDTFNTSGTGFASALGMAYEVERHGSFFAVDPKFAEGFIEDPNTVYCPGFFLAIPVEGVFRQVNLIDFR